MKNISQAVEFVRECFDLERQALDAMREADPDRYNSLFEELAARSVVPGIRFHLRPRRGPLTPMQEKMYALVPQVARARHIYKVSEYTLENQADPVFAAYCSAPNPPEEAFLYAECLWVTTLDGRPKVVAYHRWDTLDRDIPGWVFAAGDPAYDLANLHDPEHIEHLLAPKSDPHARNDYEARS